MACICAVVVAKYSADKKKREKTSKLASDDEARDCILEVKPKKSFVPFAATKTSRA